jgi:hypothetical protein
MGQEAAKTAWAVFSPGAGLQHEPLPRCAKVAAHDNARQQRTLPFLHGVQGSAGRPGADGTPGRPSAIEVFSVAARVIIACPMPHASQAAMYLCSHHHNQPIFLGTWQAVAAKCKPCWVGCVWTDR